MHLINNSTQYLNLPEMYAYVCISDGTSIYCCLTTYVLYTGDDKTIMINDIKTHSKYNCILQPFPYSARIQIRRNPFAF